MLNYLRIGGAALIALALLYGGWAVNGWRLEAQAAEVLRLELRNELQRRVAEQVRVKQADDARLAAEAALSAKEAEIAKGVKVVKETVVKYVKQNADCDLPEPVASQLQHLREGGEQ
jgi:hypothetical protein